MSTPPINLNELEYQQIFDNIKNYISSKSEFTDYDFDGSALSSIVDILAYNTHYHVLFQNILVNEMFLDSSQKLESLNSHAKVLGYTVQNRTASTTTVRVNSVPATSGISAYSRLTGTRTDNTNLNFYTIDDVEAESDGTNSFIDLTVFEAQSAVINQVFPINVDTQSVFLPDKNIDTETVRVSVDGILYTKVDSNDADPYENQNIFYVENVTNGFDVIFPSKMDIGIDLTADNEVKVSYIVPTGVNGNGASSFSFPVVPQSPTSTTIGSSASITTTGGVSRNGSTSPSIDKVKELMTKTFSSQNRFVTKSDIKTGLVNGGFANSTSDVTVEKSNNLNGKVFVNIQGYSGSTQSVIDYINERSVVGIEFEYGTESAGT